MREITRSPLNGQRVVSLFSGCGGSSLGYRMAGYKVLWANEFIPAARETYHANFPDTVIDARDIRSVTGAEILAATGLAAGELDILDGSPPCASFSMAGKRQHHWGKVKKYSDTTQRTDDLFFEYVRLLRDLQPRRFIAENVSGLVKGVGKGFFLEILAGLKAAGYRVESRLLDAQWLGVPQARQRIFFVGVRSDVDGAPGFPKPLPYRYSVRDALPWIAGVGDVRETGFHRADGMTPASQPSPTIMAGGGYGMNTSQFGVEPAPTIQTHGRRGTESEFTVEAEASANGYAVGRELDKLAAGGQSSRYFSLTRAPINGPSPTVTATGGDGHTASVAHPTERRKFSIAELRRICGFPDDFVLTGTYAQQWERLGRAVPPPMMAALARANLDTKKGAGEPAPIRTPRHSSRRNTASGRQPALSEPQRAPL
jgi:DNA (cytosine-5)-methyltransferase 1